MCWYGAYWFRERIPENVIHQNHSLIIRWLRDRMERLEVSQLEIKKDNKKKKKECPCKIWCGRTFLRAPPHTHTHTGTHTHKYSTYTVQTYCSFFLLACSFFCVHLLCWLLVPGRERHNLSEQSCVLDSLVACLKKKFFIAEYIFWVCFISITLTSSHLLIFLTLVHFV